MMPVNCMHAENITESEEKAQAYARAFSILIYFINKSQLAVYNIRFFFSSLQRKQLLLLIMPIT
jgi:hypothetical protein